jgi:hypothetical protein
MALVVTGGLGKSAVLSSIPTHMALALPIYILAR